MDEEDLSTFGIAPKKIITTSTFEEAKKRKAAADIAEKSIIPGGVPFAELIIPARLPMGVKLLRKMGWKDGQGIGARIKKKQKSVVGKKVYGCSMPPGPGNSENSDESEDEYAVGLTFAPKDVAPIDFKGKDNLHGLGYSGINPRSALGSTGGHYSLFDEPSVTKRGKKGITGHAFGIGTLEDEDPDENVYSRDDMSKYDFSLGGNERDHLHGWTAPQHRAPQATGIPGFGKSGKMCKPKKIYQPPNLPRDFKPMHRNTSGVPASTLATVTSTQDEKPKRLDANDRSAILGEKPHFKSVFDLVPDKDKQKMKAVKNMPGAKPIGSGQSTSESSIEIIPSASSQPKTGSHRKDAQQRSEIPLFTGAAAGFKPFVNNPEKQQRYEHFLELRKQSKKYEDEIPLGSMTEWERERELEEFNRAAALYRPLNFTMASRFTSAQFSDDTETVDIPVDQTETSDQAKAAQMKMFGKLTRERFEWHPDKVLCKRFNIRDPYPESTMVGVPKVRRDKFSVFNFLNNPTAAELRPEAKAGPVKAIEAPPQDKETKTEESKKDIPKLDFSLVMTEKTLADQEAEKESQRMTPAETTGTNIQNTETKEERPPMDMFRAIFADSDESSSSSSSSEDNDEGDNDSGIAPQGGGDRNTEHRQPIEPTVLSTTAQLSLSSENPVEQHIEPTTTSSSQDTRNKNLPGYKETTADSAHIYDSKHKKSRWSENTDMQQEEGCLHMSGSTVTHINDAVRERLAPHIDESAQAEEFYGPTLPPPIDISRSDESRTPGDKGIHRKHKHKHKDSRREKNKKSKKKDKKYKKHKQKKSKKKKKKKVSTDESSESSRETESDDNSEEEPSDLDLLSRLKSLPSSKRPNFFS